MIKCLKLAALAAGLAFASGTPAFAAKPEAKPEMARTSQQTQPSNTAKPEAKPEGLKAPKTQPVSTMGPKPEAKPE